MRIQRARTSDTRLLGLFVFRVTIAQFMRGYMMCTPPRVFKGALLAQTQLTCALVLTVTLREQKNSREGNDGEPVFYDGVRFSDR
jgi:hypothetical protein